MSTTDTRAKLAELFHRITDPAASDIEAMEACLWFRKLRLDAEDVGQALGTAPNGPPMTMPASLVTPAAADEGPTMPFGKYVKQPIAKLARENPDYLRWMLTKELREPLLGQIKAAMAKEGK